MTVFSDKVSDDSFPVDDRISFLGKWIDESTDSLSRENLIEALDAGRKFLTVCDNRRHLSIIHYFLANAHSVLRVIMAKNNHCGEIPWENKDLEQELIHLRISFSILRDIPVSEVATDLPFRVATNLGNALNEIGRFSEAVELWDYALAHAPGFGMAQGNRGYGLFHYARILYDSGHQLFFLLEARTALKNALSQRLEGNANKVFQRALDDIDSVVGTRTGANLKEFSLGRSRLERNYRAWVTNNRLFVNPLNDLGNRSVVATDVLTLPSIVTPLSEPPHLYGLFNQIKQEFVSARFLLFEGVAEEQKTVHFSDRNVLLYNTLDYPVYCLNIEKVKAAFLSAYSALDKIAFLLNQYFKLGIPERKVSFRNVWYATGGKSPILRSEFMTSPNWPLRGLFWLSKDLYEEDTGFKESIEPDAQELSTIRNHIAHKYFKVHDDVFWRDKHGAIDFFVDRLCLSVRRGELHRKTVKLFKLVRSALIYCALAIHFEELSKKRNKSTAIIPPVFLDVIEDQWKK
jgi:tetratricopeptide (TPR) repeat protein